MVYTYISYKLVTTLKDNEEVEVAVHRRLNIDSRTLFNFRSLNRFNDFIWLYEDLASKYDGHIIPSPPPKNILTTLNQEGAEFSETRRKQLITFMKKLTQDEFLRHTEEVNCFLFDDSKFIEMKQESELRPSKDQGLVQKLSKLFNYNNKKSIVGIKEMNENEKKIYNYEVFLNITLVKMEDFLQLFIKYADSKRHLTQTKLSILTGFHSLCN